MSLDDAVRTRIQSLLAADELVLFMKGVRGAPQCGFSAQVCEILEDYREAWSCMDMLEHEELREQIKEYSDWPTIPQLYVKGEFVGGADILAQMHESGELEALLGEKRQRPALPGVEITEVAAEQISAALADLEGDVLRLAVDYRYHNDLSIGPAEDDDMVVESTGIALHFDVTSARRADGLKLDFVTNDQGTGFKIDNPNAPPSVRDMSVKELQARLQSKALVFDVRNEHERAVACLDGTRIYDLDARRELESLDRSTPIILHCHHGGRSMRAGTQLVGMGFREVYNVVGGIDAWSQEIDSTVPRY